jgi:VWFA-related protein
MTRAAVVVIAIAALGTVSSPAPPQDPPQATFRSGAAAVVVDVAVRDRTRRPLTGLKAEDFQVLDNGVPQQVDEVSYGKLPIDVTVALDVSYSVTGNLLDRLRRAVVDLMRDLERDDRLKLVLFNMRVTRTIDFTTDVKAVERAIRAAAAGGGTALLDAVSVSLVSSGALDRRHLVVVFTDGSETSSTTSPDVLTAVAQRARASVAFVVPTALPQVTIRSTGEVVALGGRTGGKAPGDPSAGLFTALAGETGGQILPVSASIDLSAAFRRVLDEFRSAYVLYYTPRGVDRGGYHTIDVTVSRNGAVVQARRGYFGS